MLHRFELRQSSVLDDIAAVAQSQAGARRQAGANLFERRRSPANVYLITGRVYHIKITGRTQLLSGYPESRLPIFQGL